MPFQYSVPWPPGQPPSPPALPPPGSAVPVLSTPSPADCKPPGKYVPGRVEQQWLSIPGGVAGRICQIASSKPQLRGTRVWLRHVNESNKAFASTTLSLTGGPVRTLRPLVPSPLVSSILSRFEHADGSIEYIEPLTGVARHPNHLCKQAVKRQQIVKKRNFDIRYLLPGSSCTVDGEPACHLKPRDRSKTIGRPRAAGRRYFYDLGCTVYGDRSATAERYDSGSGTGWGPSIPLFFKMFEQRCITFDHVYAWEATKYNATLWWKPVPDEMKRRLSFYNVRVSPEDFLKHLQATATKRDYVVLKVDIEGQQGGPEMQIVGQIADRPELAALVDELFFEYHFWWDGLDFGWGNVTRSEKYRKKMGSADDALRLMLRLRQQGVRAHFWI